MGKSDSNTPPKSSAHFGSPLLPACAPHILVPIVTPYGVLKVIPIHELELHAVVLDGFLLAMHANGYSVRNLAERVVQAWKDGSYQRATDQLEYIERCGGITMTPERFNYLLQHVIKQSPDEAAPPSVSPP